MGGSCDDRSTPLRIILGTFSGGVISQSFNKTDGVVKQSTPTADGASAESPTTYILGTSYFATPSLGSSNSNSSSNNRRLVLKLNKDGRVPMEDRRGSFSQFKPKSLLLSTVRVTAINISTTLSKFFSDQLNSEQQIESRVESGEITTRQADELNEEWENREWQVRMDALPKKISWAILRFHACTAIMRFYEFVMARYVLKVDGGSIMDSASSAETSSTMNSTNSLSQERAITIMDKLTRDTFQASKRTSQLLHNQEHAPGKVISSTDGIETSTNRELAKQMFSTCLWANIIPFLAELTVQQGVLIYGYGVYYVAKQKRRKKREGEQMQAGGGDEDANECEEVEGEDDDISESAYALSLMFRSSRLSIARCMSWISASMGGSLGSVVYPGWGTMFGTQIGDALIGALLD